MKKLFFVSSMIFVFMTALCVYSQTVSRDLQSGIIRLHILARSNSEYDQKIKLEVRDEILKAVSDIPATDTKRFAKTAENTANIYLEKNNLPYRAKSEYGMFTFPRKTYGNVTLPAGEYNGVRVILDNGNGENWWCVMYPPLCVSDKSEDAKKVLETNLNNETYQVITKKPEVRFKVLELMARII